MTKSQNDLDQGTGSSAEAARRDDAAETLQALAVGLGEAGYDDAAEFAYQAAAALDLTDAELQKGWGGPLNGQHGRCKAFLALVRALDVSAIVETGTYRGISTEWMAENFGGPIYTSEINPRFFYQARQKLSRFPLVTCELKDSRVFLRDIIPLLPIDSAVVFYLDAHWADDLPLCEELDLILRSYPGAVVMIDDFAVPYDHGYRWDDYGPEKRLTLEILDGTRAADAQLFFPSLPSAAETGAKRGCVVLTTNARLAASIEATGEFRRADWREWRLVEIGVRAEELERENVQLHAQLAQTREALSAAQNLHLEEKAVLLRAREEAALAAERVRSEASETLERMRMEIATTWAEAVARAHLEAAEGTARASEAVARMAERVEQEGAQALASRAHAHALALEKAALAEEKASLERDATTLAAELVVLREKMSDRNDAIATLEAALEQARLEVESCQRELDRREAQLARMTDQLKVTRAYVGIIE